MLSPETLSDTSNLPTFKMHLKLPRVHERHLEIAKLVALGSECGEILTIAKVPLGPICLY